MRLPTSVANRLEHLEAIDRFADPPHRAAQWLRSRRRLTDLLSGRPIGHPAHPALILLPAGCWIGAAVGDVAGNEDGARNLIGVGTVAVLPAALTGLADWADTEGAEQRIGFIHLGLNLVATGSYAVSWWLRRNRRGPAAVTASLVGGALTAAAGWLGGHLVYADGVGVDTTAFQAGPTEWTAIGPPPAEGAVEQRRAGGVPLAVLQAGGIPRVVADRCTHRGGPLSDGEVTGNCLSCPWHGSQFDADSGDVLRGPASIGQPSYESRVRDGDVEVRRVEERTLRTNPVT